MRPNGQGHYSRLDIILFGYVGKIDKMETPKGGETEYFVDFPNNHRIAYTADQLAYCPRPLEAVRVTDSQPKLRGPECWNEKKQKLMGKFFVCKSVDPHGMVEMIGCGEKFHATWLRSCPFPVGCRIKITCPQSPVFGRKGIYSSTQCNVRFGPRGIHVFYNDALERVPFKVGDRVKITNNPEGVPASCHDIISRYGGQIGRVESTDSGGYLKDGIVVAISGRLSVCHEDWLQWQPKFNIGDTVTIIGQPPEMKHTGKPYYWTESMNKSCGKVGQVMTVEGDHFSVSADVDCHFRGESNLYHEDWLTIGIEKLFLVMDGHRRAQTLIQASIDTEIQIKKIKHPHPVPSRLYKWFRFLVGKPVEPLGRGGIVMMCIGTFLMVLSWCIVYLKYQQDHKQLPNQQYLEILENGGEQLHEPREVK